MSSKIKTIEYKKKLLELIKTKKNYLFLGLTIFLLLFFYPSLILINKYQKNIKTTKEKNIIKNKETFYQIKEGDYLWKIAEDFYGSGFNAYDIAVANKLTEPYDLTSGQKLILPKVTPKEATKGEISATSSGQIKYFSQTYIVQPGDDLCQIAVRFYGDCNMGYQIVQANNILNPDIIEAGTVLQIPR